MMGTVQPANVQPPRPPEAGRPVGGAFPGGFGYTINQLGGITNGLKHWLIAFLAQLQAMEKLMKEEEAAQAAASDYRQNPTKANAKAFFAALKALRNYIHSHDGQPAGYTQFGKNLGKKVQLAIAAEIKEAAYGQGPDGKTTGPSIIEVIQRLVTVLDKDPAKLKQEIKDFFEGKDPPGFENRLLNAVSWESHEPVAAKAYESMLQGLQNLFGQASDLNKVFEARIGLYKSDIEAIMQGASKLASKAYQTILTMIKLITGG